MAETPQMDMGAQLFARGGGNTPSAAPAKVNEDTIFDNATKPEDFLHKMADFFGLGGLLPHNAGQVSIFAGLESQGLASKPINVGKGGVGERGVLAQFVTSLANNKAITDLTAGIGKLEWQESSFSSLGNISAPTFAGVSGQGMGAGFEVG